MAVRGKGMAPLDALEDFSNPTTAPGSPAEEELGVESALDSEITEEEQAEESPQEELPMDQPDTPKAIRDGKMLCEFVRPHFSKEEAGDRYVGFEFSFPLTKEHEENGHLPGEVIEEWQHMRNGNVKRTDVMSIDPQTIAIGLVPDNAADDLILVAAKIEKPVLTIVEEKGSGKKGKVIRLSFRAVVDQVEQVAKFAVDHHGDSVWINLQRTQGSLL